jgi:hypothetical protein
LPAYRGSDDRSQVANNLESLALAARHLAKGDCVGIFPEGKSHDALKLDKVKSGAARIAVQAVQEGARDLVVVPLGINYERKEKVRSSIWVRVSEPIHLKDWTTQIAENEKAAQRALTSEIDIRLRQSVIHLDEEQWEPFISDLECLLPPAGIQRRTPVAALRQRKRIADAINFFLATDRSKSEGIAAEIKAHREALNTAGVSMQSDLFRLRYGKLFLRQTLDFAWMVLGFVPALLGTLHHLIPYLLVRMIAAKIPRSNRSVISLTHLGIGIPLYGAAYAAIWWGLSKYFVAGVATAWSVLMFLAGLFALGYWPRTKRALQLWWTELQLLLEKKALAGLRDEQHRLQALLQELAAKYRKTSPVEIPEELPPLWPIYLKRAASWVLITAVAVGIGFFSMEWYHQSRITVLQQSGLELGNMRPDAVQALVAEDERMLTEILKGLDSLEQRALAVQADLATGKRNFLNQSDNDAIRQLLFTFLSHRTELLRIIWKYQGFEKIGDEPLRLRTFLLEVTAASALYEGSFKVVTRFAQSPDAIRKLNEGEPLWEIPTGLYDMIRANLAAARNQELMEDSWEFYDRAKPRFAQLSLMAGEPHDLFHQTITQARRTTVGIEEYIHQWRRTLPIEHARKSGREVLYKGQSMLSTWVGDTRVRQPRQGKPLIQRAELEQLRTLLKPGDILIERQNWYLSRAFMPGYWAHAALYVGSTNDLVRMGLDQHPQVKLHWDEFAKRDAAGHEHLILEAVPAGVRITTLEHCLGVADSAAVLRPKIREEELPEVIAQAFSHLGKPYDFEFDFFSTDKLVCTELVYRSCDHKIDFPLVEVMGRKTLPPTEVVRKFARERGQATAQLQFVAFLDGEESRGRARFKDEAAFAETINRPSLTWLQKE